MSEIVGYTVAVVNEINGNSWTEIVGSVHVDRERAENHLDYCRAMSARRAAEHNSVPGNYRVVGIVEVSP